VKRMPAKYEWMHEHFPFIPDSHLVFCGDKSIIAADFLHHVRAPNSRCRPAHGQTTGTGRKIL
jgi:5'(3')-deoxyribonucleotidase